MEYDPAQLYESVALYIVALGLDDNDEKDFEAVLLDKYVHVQVRDLKGEVWLKVVGKDYNELGEQLVLACLHNISEEHLGALHVTSRQEVPQTLRRV